MPPGAFSTKPWMLLPFDEHVPRVRNSRPQPPAPACVMVADQSVGVAVSFCKKACMSPNHPRREIIQTFLYHTVPDAPPPLSLSLSQEAKQSAACSTCSTAAVATSPKQGLPRTTTPVLSPRVAAKDSFDLAEEEA